MTSAVRAARECGITRRELVRMALAAWLSADRTGDLDRLVSALIEIDLNPTRMEDPA